MIPGFLISIITFPGVIIHEWAHKKYCDLTGVKVNKVVYFRFGNPAGYVMHEEPSKYSQTFWISVGPFIINSFAAIFLSFLAYNTESGSFINYLLLWIGLSVGMHSFPSDHDAKNILSRSKKSLKGGGSILHLLAFPFFIIIWIANKLRFFWIDFFYAILLLYLGGGLQ